MHDHDSLYSISLRNVTAGYGSQPPVLSDFDLSVPHRACFAVVGPSGCGKTTLLRLILGQLAPRSGSIECNSPHGGMLGRRCVGYIPQALGLVRNLSVRDNVLLGALGRMPWWRTVTGVFPAADVQRADEVLTAVGLDGKGNERIDRLSGGQKRRVAIARALVQKPCLLLADEFLAELDPATAEDVVQLLDELRRERPITIVFVDHDVEAACRVADRIVAIAGGRKVAEVDAAEAMSGRLRALLAAGAA
jgi:phosphonate transport system ATP-binding protein